MQTLLQYPWLLSNPRLSIINKRTVWRKGGCECKASLTPSQQTLSPQENQGKDSCRAMESCSWPQWALWPTITHSPFVLIFICQEKWSKRKKKKTNLSSISQWTLSSLILRSMITSGLFLLSARKMTGYNRIILLLQQSAFSQAWPGAFQRLIAISVDLPLHLHLEGSGIGLPFSLQKEWGTSARKQVPGCFARGRARYREIGN